MRPETMRPETMIHESRISPNLALPWKSLGKSLNLEKQGKVEIDHSRRAYDGAHLTWHRVFGPYEWSHWFLVKVSRKE